MSHGTGTTGSTKALTLKDIEDALEKIQGIPPVKWVLVAPDGRTFAEEDPRELAIFLMFEVLKYGRTFV